MEPDRLLMVVAALVYACAAALTLGALARRRAPPHQVVFGLVLIGFGIQSTGLHLRGVSIGACPIGNTFEVLQFISWSVILVYVFTGAVYRVTILGAVSATLAAVLGLTSAAVPAWDETRRVGLFGGNVWVETHAAMAFLSYGIFGLLAATSVLFLLQNYSLKKKRWPSRLRFLPSVVQLEAINLRLLAVGFAVFTVALGIAFTHMLVNPSAVFSIKLLSTTLLWIAYGIVLSLRIRQKLFGRRLAWVNAVLFLFALSTLWSVEASRKDHTPEEPAVQTAPVRFPGDS